MSEEGELEQDLCQEDHPGLHMSQTCHFRAEEEKDLHLQMLKQKHLTYQHQQDHQVEL